MIYKCENCKNRNNCCENKEQYERTCKTVGDIASAIDRKPDYHCYYSLTIKCDYWVEDKETYGQSFNCGMGVNNSGKKLTDNEIVKALETCCGDNGCFGCPYTENHSCRLLRNPIKDALDLINRLQRENKNYSQNNQTMIKDVLELQKENARLKMTNEILSINADTAFQDGLNEAQELYAEQIKVEIKAEAYNEFAEWLYSLFPTPNSEIAVISRTGIAKKVNELVSEGSNIE